MNTDKQITNQSVFKRMSKDKLLFYSQLAIVAMVALDYLYGDSLLSDVSSWYLIALAMTAVVIAIPSMTKLKLLSRNYVIQSLLHLVMALSLVFVIPVGSFYEWIAVLLLFSNGYWFGVKGFLYSLVTFIAAFAWQAYYQFDLLTTDALIDFSLRSILLVLTAIIMQRILVNDHKERAKLYQLSKEVTLERERLISLINSMGDAVISTDMDGVVKLYNGAALGLLNTNASIEDHKLIDFMRLLDEDEETVDIIEETKQADALVKRRDLYFYSNEDEKVNIDISVSPVRLLGSNDSDDDGFICLIRDITKEKSIEEQRDEFISVVSHELRTPIAITEANISTALLPKNKLTKKAKELLNQAHKNVVFLADLVNDITTLAHAERGDLNVDLEEFDPSDVVRELVDTYKDEAKDKNLNIKSKIEKDVNKINSSTYRAKEILQNFITNSIKYSDEGTITVGVKPAQERDAAIFWVADEGIGMSAADRKHAFDKFYRAEDYRTRQSKGTGLGLYITKKLAERMDGRVWIESKKGEGSTFYLELPSLDEAEAKDERV